MGGTFRSVVGAEPGMFVRGVWHTERHGLPYAIRRMFPGLLLVSVVPLLVMARALEVLTASGDATECSAAKPPPALGGSLASPEAKFRWESDAGPADSGMVCFDRRVRNWHTNDKLVFYWPPGDMRSFEGIPPGGEYHYNAVLPADIETRQGPLYYGVKDNSIATAVYREKERGTSVRSGRSAANYSLAVRASSGRHVTTTFSISTSFSQSGEFTYTITNKGSATLLIGWIGDVHAFDAALVAYKKDRPDHSFDVPGGLKTAPGQKAMFTLEALVPWAAKLKTSVVLIYSVDRKIIAAVPYPGFFPVGR